MEDVTLAHAKEHLEELIARAAKGEDVRIVDPRHGTVRLTPAPGASDDKPLYPPRVFGLMKHLPEIPDERLLAPLTEEELAWLSGERSEVE